MDLIGSNSLRIGRRISICPNCLHTLRSRCIATSQLHRLLRFKHDSTKSHIAPSGSQAHKIHGFYKLLLTNAYHHPTQPPRPLKAPPPTTSSRDDGAPSPPDDVRARAAIVFGSRLTGPQRLVDKKRHSRVIAGVTVPPRPDEPDNCCMSGCVNCVWDQYREEMEEWAVKEAEAREAEMRLKKTGTERGKKIRGKRMSLEDDVLQTGDRPELFKDIPVGIREFMRTEKMLKEKRARDQL